MPVTPWTAETDRILLLAVLAATTNLNLPMIASCTGYSLNSVQWRFRTLKKEAAFIRSRSQTAGGEPSTPVSKKRARSTFNTPSPVKKRKISARSGKGKRKILDDTSDEEPSTPLLSESERENTPSLHGDEGDETSASSVEPVTPTKVLPRRKAKPAPGYYKQLDEGSELELEDEEVDDSQAE